MVTISPRDCRFSIMGIREECEMAICEICGEEFSENRNRLGYDTCLVCGEAEAKLEIKQKSRRVGVAYNKGPLQFITSMKMVKDLGR